MVLFRSKQCRFVLLYVFCALCAFDILSIGASQSRSSRHRYRFSPFTQRRHPPRNPNPPPTIEDLEEQATTNDVIDMVIDQVVGVNGGVVVDRYIPSGNWLWQQWHSSVFSNTVRTTCWRMLLSFFACCVLRRTIFGDWKVWKHHIAEISTQHHRRSAMLLHLLDHFDTIWKAILPLTTVALTFFVGQAYTFWVSVYLLCRSIQGRISDIQMILATHVRRKNDSFNNLHRRPFGGQRRNQHRSVYTPDAEEFLEDVSNQLRAFHVLFWASQARRFRILLTDRGMNRLVSKGILSQDEKENLDLQLGVPKNQKHWILLESVALKCKEAQEQNQRNKRAAVLEGGNGLEQSLLDKLCSLRSSCCQIAHEMAARMSFSYAQFVQVLVDSFLFLAPIAQYKEMGIWVVLLTGVLTIFYSGFLGLAFDFLDPFLDDKESAGSATGDSNGYDNCAMYFDLSVLIRESAAAARRWINAGSKLTGYQ